METEPSEFLKELTSDLLKELDKLRSQKRQEVSFIENHHGWLFERMLIIRGLLDNIEENIKKKGVRLNYSIESSDPRQENSDPRQKALIQHIDNLSPDKCLDIITAVLNEAKKIMNDQRNRKALHTHIYKDRGKILNFLTKLIAKIHNFDSKTSSEKILDKHLENFNKTSPGTK